MIAGVPVVDAPAGVVRGGWEGGVAVFRGMPFAKAPVGVRRFGAPEPVGRWGGVRDATAFGPPPPQGGALGMGALSRDQPGDDWLTVNVWTPEPGPGAALPVMVWIHGGGYTVGTGALPEYDGGRLAREGGVVLVTLNYRVGLEGFGHVEGAPDNRGLLDQVAALTWVRDNIRAFGGDPDRVTVFGQSAGGGSVAALLAMPRAAGLFRRAVAQSAQGTFFTRGLAADIATVCAAELGLRPTAADLAGVPPAELAAAGDAVAATMARWAERWGPIAHRSVPYSPVVDGDSLPVTPWQALAAGACADVDLLVGHTRDEQRLLTALEGLLGQVTPEQAAAALAAFGPDAGAARRYRDGYPAAGPDELHELVLSDWLFRMPSLRLAEARTAAGSTAHVYELTWPAPGMGGVLGACHGLDVPLVFGNLDRGQPALLLGESPPPEAEAVSAQLRAAWTSFATSGDPGWPPYDAGQRRTRRFDTVPAVVPYPEETSRRIWQDHDFRALPLLGG
ncbi:carboxylesterase family protein [Streptomyces sp. SP17BM10]|uniref:carboxylesterase/lipase family protein n=1 Tax=Streptomyces sp. SP17BM10 TaxID=3002530 RepID=UPI002E7646F1|nr:carboxylesterase family protein [Streptomyces sp. SP17BM10]MEE1782896.1 carboxylesterase family protein [Streptomyces sp. SP17BM10]